MPRLKLQNARPGFSLIELVVVLFITVIVVGLVMCAVQRNREARMRSETHCNLRNMALGMHNFYSTHKKFPASVGYFPDVDAGDAAKPAGHGTVFYYLLPSIEKDDIYRKTTGNSRSGGTAVVSTFIAPMDPTVPSSGITPGTKLAATSYAANWFVFQGDRKGKSGPVGGLKDIMDGTSSTVMFIEWYASCGKSDRNWATDVDKAIGDLGSGPGATVINGAPAWWGGLKTPTAFGNNNGTSTATPAENIIPVFDVAPRQRACNPMHVQSFEGAGIHVALCDGTSRIINQGISQQTWQTVFTPAAGDLVLNDDWD